MEKTKGVSRWPHSVKSGGVTVKIYRNRHPSYKGEWVYIVSHYGLSGKRQREKFSTQAEALAEARRKAEQVSNGHPEVAGMKNSDLQELLTARGIAGHGNLIPALQEWAKARELTDGNIIPAAESWARRNIADHERQKMGDVLTEFLAEKRTLGIQTEKNHAEVYRNMREAFGHLFLDSISSQQIKAYLARQTHPSTYNTHRKHIVSVWRWAQKAGYLARDLKTEAELTSRATEEALEPGIIDVPTLRTLLEIIRKDHPHYVAPMALAAFCGMRRSEIHAQQWADIHLSRKFLKVSSAKRGTQSKRIIELSDVAIAWLSLEKDRTDKVCYNLAIDRIRNIGRDAGLNLPENSLRHSWISYRVAVTKNIPAVALEAGNSPTVINQHYRELVAPEIAPEWFKSFPGNLEGVAIKQKGEPQ